MTYKSDQKIDIIIDKQTGEPKRIKHLNQVRIDRCYGGTPPGGWNKTGKKKRTRNWSKDSERKREIENLKKYKGIDISINKDGI